MATKVTKKPLYHLVEGVTLPMAFSEKLFREALAYKPRPDDVIICTYPKCGTTWIQNVVMYIYRKGRPLDQMQDFFKMCPFVDMVGQEGIDKMPRPGAIKTHLSYSRMPYSPDAKYIFVVRDPRDCCVSLYHHTTRLPAFGYSDGEFDEFFELFMLGEVEFDDYFDHLLSWYPHRNDKNVFYTTYEEMQRDLTAVVLRLADFLGEEYGDAVRKDSEVLKSILHRSSFDFMKKNLSKCFEKMKVESDEYEGRKHLMEFSKSVKDEEENKPKTDFVRKGIVGDYVNHFNEDQLRRLKEKFVERTKGTEIPQWFPKWD